MKIFNLSKFSGAAWSENESAAPLNLSWEHKFPDAAPYLNPWFWKCVNISMHLVKENSINLSNSSTDDEIMELMGITCDGKPTMAAVLTFGKYPHRNL